VNLEKQPAPRYLGALISSDGKDSPDIENRLKKADATVYRLRKVLRCRSIPLNLRIKALRVFVYPTATYGCETWTLLKKDRERLDIWWRKQLRSILGVNWYDKLKDDDLLQRTCGSKNLTTMIDNRRIRYAGHLWRYPHQRPARQAMFAKWNLTRTGHAKIKNTWQDEVSDFLVSHELRLDEEKEVFKNRLTEIYNNHNRVTRS
jgi:hypothetical protein